MDYHSMTAKLLAINVFETQEDLQWIHRIKMINPEVIKHINPLVAEMEKHIQEIKVGWEPIVLWSQKSPEEKQKIFDKYRTKNLPNWEAMKADFKRQKEEMKANQ